LTFRLC